MRIVNNTLFFAHIKCYYIGWWSCVTICIAEETNVNIVPLHAAKSQIRIFFGFSEEGRETREPGQYFFLHCNCDCPVIHSWYFETVVAFNILSLIEFCRRRELISISFSLFRNLKILKPRSSWENETTVCLHKRHVSYIVVSY